MARVFDLDYISHKLYFADDGYNQWCIRRVDYFQWIHDLLFHKFRDLLRKSGNKKILKTVVRIYRSSPKITEYPWDEPMFLGDAPKYHAFPMAFEGSYDEVTKKEDDFIPQLPPKIGVMVFREPLKTIPTDIASSSTDSYSISHVHAEYDSHYVGLQIKHHLSTTQNSVAKWYPLSEEEDEDEQEGYGAVES